MRVVLSIAASLAVLPTLVGQGLRQQNQVVVETTLDAVRAEPEAFKRVWIRFPVQFCSIGRLSNPFFTRFVPSDFANFYAWSAEQPIWQKTAYDDLFGMLFLSKDHAQLQDLYRLGLYDRVEITGVVQNTFQDKPWIQVMTFEPIDGKVNTATLAHLYRGEQHMERREWRQAISELSLAPAAGSPTQVLAAVHKNLGICYLRLGETGLARAHLDSAVVLLEQPGIELRRLVSTASSAPTSELDRAVDRSGIPEFERPMWEAFEDLGSAAANPVR